MSEPEVLPEIKQIIGAMILAAGRPVSVQEMRRCLVEVANEQGGAASAFAGIKESHVHAALEELQGDLSRNIKTGFELAEVAGGYRYQSDRSCGIWLKHMLEIGKPNRLSKPALETLAIIAYRQPVSRAEIEGVRGVNVDHIMKSLLEYRLIKIAGRSELPGRPFVYGTTQLFLEHFGLKGLDDLREIEPMLLMAREGKRKAETVHPKPVVEDEKTAEGGDLRPEGAEQPETGDVEPEEEVEDPVDGADEDTDECDECEGEEDEFDDDEDEEEFDDEDEDDDDDEDEESA